jgi:HAE1 family hydrophobic/amphiphilic exporter-1
MLSARMLKRTEKKRAENAAAASTPSGPRRTGSLEEEAARAKASKQAEASKQKGFYRFLDRAYTWLLEAVLRRRWIVVVASAVALLSVGPLFKAVPKNFLPYDDESQFEVNFRTPEGTTLEQTALIGQRLAEPIRKFEGVAYTLLTVGGDEKQTPTVGVLYVKLKGVKARKQPQTAIMDRVRKSVLPLHPELRSGSVDYVSAFSGMGKNTDIQYVVNGPDIPTLGKVSDRLQASLKKVPGVVDVDSSLILGKPEIGVNVLRDKASDMGVAVADVAETLRILVAGEKVGSYDEAGEQYDVYLQARPEDRSRPDSLSRYNVPSARLGGVSLDDVTTQRSATGPAEINRLNRRRQITITANMLPGYSAQKAIDALVKETKAMKLGPGYESLFLGASKEQGRAAQSFLLAFTLSIVFMYLILAAQFESWLHPVTILLSLPLTVPFALLSILLFGQSLNIFTALGILVLFGVVKKNSILQVEFANQLRDRGLARNEAVILASRERLRPILMTTLAFVAGMLPLLVSSGDGAGTNRAIGSVIAGGQTLALLLTLLATPVAYTLFDDWKSLIGRLVGRIRGKREGEMPAEVETEKASLPVASGQ